MSHLAFADYDAVGFGAGNNIGKVGMDRSADELAQTERFEDYYEMTQTPVMLAVERTVCGCDYGGNSWTTLAEADGFIAALNLSPSANFLDLGAGSGWPGLYMAKSSGCRVTLVDLPVNGLRIADERAVKDGISHMVETVIGDAAHLTFSDASFDAISHSDLLCCLVEKQPVLRECRRVVRLDGRMAFTVLSISPGLSSAQHRRAIASSPDFVESDSDYSTMLGQSGWDLIDCKDLTSAYAASCRRQLEAEQANTTELAKLIGNGEVASRLKSLHEKLAAIGDGLLRRHLYLAKPRAK